MRSVGKQPLQQSGKYRVNKNDEENFQIGSMSEGLRDPNGSIVMAGLVPAIRVFVLLQRLRRGCPRQARA